MAGPLRVPLDKLGAADDNEEHNRNICEQLTHMGEFHIRLLEMHRRFINEWKEEAAQRSSVEVYRQDMDERPRLSG